MILLADSWSDLLARVGANPQNYVVWVIVFLIVLFLLSRLRNIMEERSVNRAIYISRGMVGTIIAFIITPIVFFILLNIVALVHGVNTIDIGFLAKWLGLTVTSYWWLLKCFFGSESLSGAAEMYSPDALIRILWIILPFSLIWIRMSSTKIGKLFLIPLIIGVFVITRYKKAPETFITQDEQLMRRIPGLNMFSNDPNAPTAKSSISNEQRKFLAGGLLLLLIAGFVVGLYLQRRLIGLFMAAVGLLGFLLMAPHEKEKVIPEKHEENYNANLDSMIQVMNYLHAKNPDTLELYHLSLQVKAGYDARLEVGDMIVFPDSLCTKFEPYFYDWCKENNK